MVDFLWSNRKNLLNEYNEWEFDYPNYGGLPKKISNKLSGEAVDRIQNLFQFPDRLNTKAKFRSEMRDALFLLAS